MSDQVELSVRSQLSKIIGELEKVRDAGKETEETFKKIADSSSEAIEKATKKTETYFDTMKGFGRRAFSQVLGDMKTLASVQALGSGLSLANQFKGSIRETLSLSDAIRKLGTTLGLSSKDFSGFQTKMTKGLGEIGLSSEVAANSLAGLAQTPVRGQENLLQYSKQSGMLASVSREQGKEGDIAKGVADVIKAKGGDVNDMQQVKAVMEDLRRVFTSTGKGPTDTLKAMESLFTNMSSDFRKTVTTRGLAQMAAAGQVAGPNATKFLEEYMSKSPVARMAMDNMGMKGVVKDTGEIDTDKLAAFASRVNSQVQGDPRLAAQVFGMSEEASEGFIRLSQSLDRVKQAQEGVRNATGDLNKQYESSMGFAESFRANINRVKGMFGGVLGTISQKGSDLLSESSKSTAGSAAVVGGAALASAILTGGGIKGIGKSLLGGAKGELKKKAIETMTGEKVQNVFVVNAEEIGGHTGAALSDAASVAGKGAGMLGKAGKVAGGISAVAGAASVGYAIGEAIEPYSTKALDKYTTGKTDEGFEGNAVERLAFKLDRLLGGRISGVSPSQYDKGQKVIVELNKRDLKESKQPSRGAAF